MVRLFLGASHRSGHIEAEAILLCACCRQRFGDAHRDTVRTLCVRHAIRWDRLLAAAIEHGVAPLVGANLEKAQGSDHLVPRETLLRFKLATLGNRAAKERAGSAAADLLAYCNERSLPVMLIKGMALDHLVYQPPGATVSVDVDLVMGVRHDEIGTELKSGLYEFLATLERRTGWAWECEWFTHHDITLDGLLPVSFHRIWEDAVAIQSRGQTAFVMSPEDLLIAACISCHRRRYLRLKLLCDVAETVARYPELDWDLVWSKSLQYRCSAIVYAALLASSSTLGLETPLGAPPQPHVSPAHARLIRGLFGRIDPRILEWGTTYAAGNADWSLLKTYATLRLEQLGPQLKKAMKKLTRRHQETGRK